MSHAPVLVALPPGTIDIEASVKDQMAPFCVHGNNWGADGSRWDWYVIGGRWIGELLIQEGVPITLGTPGLGRNEVPKGRSDVALKRDVDWEMMIIEEEARAGVRYDRFTAIRDSLPEVDRIFLSWDEVRSRFGWDEGREGRPKYKQDEARDFYWNQPLMKACFKLGWRGCEPFARRDRDDYVRHAGAIWTYAFLQDRHWHEKD